VARKTSKNGKEPQTPDKPPRRRSTDSNGRGLSLRIVRAVVLTGAIGIALLAALYGQKARLHASPACRERLARIRLANRPDWMPRELTYVITSEIQPAGFDGKGNPRSVFEEGIARDVWAKATANPWIAQVDRVVRGPTGDVAVYAQYHRPRALVRSSAKPAMQLIPVTIDGVVLPTIDGVLLDVAAFKQIHNVAGEPPAAGQVWEASDLADGLKVLKLFWSKPYVDEITVIDVQNHDGRRDPRKPEITVDAQMGWGPKCEIIFGRLPVGDDYAVSLERRMAYLDQYYQQNGRRLTGPSAASLDLRFDELHVTYPER